MCCKAYTHQTEKQLWVNAYENLLQRVTNKTCICIKLQEQEVQFTHTVAILGLSFPCSQNEEKGRGKWNICSFFFLLCNSNFFAFYLEQTAVLCIAIGLQIRKTKSYLFLQTAQNQDRTSLWRQVTNTMNTYVQATYLCFDCFMSSATVPGLSPRADWFTSRNLHR